MILDSEWITLATTPPSSAEALAQIVRVLAEAKIDSSVTENPARMCERDPAAWLRVRTSDLALAWDLLRKLGVETENE